MAINFAAASTAGLNNPGTEIITLVKDGSGSFINPPSYDKMRAYLSSGEVPMLFVTDVGGETGSLYQFVEYSETESKIRFSNDTNAIEFCAGCEVPNLGGGSAIPAPIKTGSLLRGSADIAKWSEVDANGGYGYTEGQTVIEWDGNASGKAEVSLFGVYYYNVSEKVPSSEELIGGIAVGKTETRPFTISSGTCVTISGIITISDIYQDLSILVVPNDNFHFEYSEAGTLFEADFPKKGVYFAKYPDSTTNFVHSLTYGNEIIHQIAEKYLPKVVHSGAKEIILSSSTTNSTKKFKITVDDSGTISTTEVT